MKTYTIYIDEKEVTEKALEIIKKFIEKSYFIKYDSVEDFLTKTTQNIWRLYGKGVDVGEGTLEEKCERYLDQLIEYGLIRQKRENI